MRILVAVMIALLVAVPMTVSADPPEGKGYKAHKHHGEGDEDERDEHRGHKTKRDEEGRREFGDDDRLAIREYFDAHPREVEELPPGLRKKAARGRQLPPGWERKLQRGEVIPDDIWVHRVPLPPEITVKLPVPPPGVVMVRIHDHVVRVIEKTHQVLDELGIPHPPTPP